MTRILRTCSYFFLACWMGFGQDPQAQADSPEKVVWIDRSSSMAGERIQAAVESGKFMVFLMDGRLMIGHFASDAKIAGTFSLPTDRPAAMAAVEGLVKEVGGGTDYVAGLRLTPLSAQVIIWLSDGEPRNAVESLQFVRDKIRCPIHAIAYQAPAGAYEVHSRMAAASQGAAHNVATAEQLAEAFLAINEQIRQSRRAEGKGRLKVQKVQGECLAIGIGAEPSFSGSPAVERHVASLGGGKIHAARIHLAAPQDIEVQLPSGHEQGRLIVIRFDLPRSLTKIQPASAKDASEPFILARTRFHQDGVLVEPQPGDVTVQYDLVNSSGEVVSTTLAQMAADKKEFHARVPVSTAAGKSGYHLRATTSDQRGSVAFVERQSRALEIEKPNPPPSPPPPPAPPRPAPDLLRLRVNAQRRTGTVVVYDSAIAAPGEAVLVGDPISLELRAGPELSATEFLTLGRSLKAEIVSEDGAIRAVPLEYREGRFVTAAVPMPSPGRLKVQVLINVQGTAVKIEGQIEVFEPRWQMVLDDPCRGLGVLPQFALLPYHVAIDAKIGSRPASRLELEELITRHDMSLVATRVDSSGRRSDSLAVNRDSLLARPDSLDASVHFVDLGEQTVHFVLSEAQGRVFAETRLRLNVVESPLAHEVKNPTPSSVPWWIAWLPSWFRATETSRLQAHPEDSPISNLFYVAGASLNSKELEWHDDGFAARLSGGGHELRARLEPYHVAGAIGPGELQLVIPLQAIEAEHLNWWRIVGTTVAALVLTSLACLVLQVCCVWSWDPCTLEMWGGTGETLPINTRWWCCIWPQSELLLYRRGQDEPLEIGPVAPAGASVVAKLIRTRRRRVVVRTTDPAQTASQLVLDENHPTVEIGDGATLIASFGAEAQPVLA